MQYHRKHSYADIQAMLEQPAMAEPMQTAELIESLNTWLREFDGSKDHRLTMELGLRQFAVFCEHQKRTKILVDEEVLDGFAGWLEAMPRNHSEKWWKRASAGLRRLMTNAGTSQGWLLRPLAAGKLRTKLKRFSALTETTREAMVWYERNGRQIRSERATMQRPDGKIVRRRHYTVTGSALAPYPKANRLDRLIFFLETIGRQCVTEVTAADCRRYLAGDAPGDDLRQRDMVELAGMFANWEHAGYLDTNPFGDVDYARTRTRIKADFISMEGIQALLDQVSVMDSLSPVEVRALTYCLLAYDTALRNSELRALNITDFQDNREKDMVTVRVRSETQKGQGKLDRLMLFLFPQTKTALRYYLRHVRPQFEPVDEALFVTNRHRRMSISAADADVKRMARKLGLQTHGGKDISSHIFRHTFASLNIQPLGLSLSLDEVVDRLRHDDMKTARQVYITNNPYIESKKLEARIDRATSTGDPMDVLDRLPLDMVMAWLKNRIGAPATAIRSIERAAARQEQADLMKARQGGGVFTLKEADAMNLLHMYTISEASLQQYAQEAGIGRKIQGQWYYREDVLWELRNEYMLLQEALQLLHITRQTVFNRASEFGKINIGRIALVRKQAVLEYAQRNG